MHPYKALLFSGNMIGSTIGSMNPILINQAVNGRGWFSNVGKSIAKVAKKVVKTGVKVYRGAKKVAKKTYNAVGKIPVVGKLAQNAIDQGINLGVNALVPGGMERLKQIDKAIDIVENVANGDNVVEAATSLGDIVKGQGIGKAHKHKRKVVVATRHRKH